MNATAPATELDLLTFRGHFPSLQREVGGRLPAFLDNPAGTQVPQQVIDRTVDYYLTANANTDGAFRTSRNATGIFDQAHQAMADMLGAASADEVVFGQNMTSLTFAISRAIGRTLGEGDEIVVTRLDHDANVAPWRALTERGATIRVVDIHPEDCTLDMDGLRAAINERTRVVAVTYCSNLVGTIVDVAEVCRLAREVGAISYIDAVQYAAHGGIDVLALGCDFLACSSYKFFGPHLGIVYGRRERLEALQAYKVRPADDVPPGKLETGTQSFESAAGLLGTFDYLETLGRAALAAGEHGDSEVGRRHLLGAAFAAMRHCEAALGARLIEGLGRIPGVRIWGVTDPAQMHRRVPTVSFTMDGLAPRAIAERLAAAEIYVWSGNNYALSLTERLGLEDNGGMVRVGPVHYNTAAEIDLLLNEVDALKS